MGQKTVFRAASSDAPEVARHRQMQKARSERYRWAQSVDAAAVAEYEKRAAQQRA